MGNYSKREEQFNILTHGLGMVGGVLGLILMIGTAKSAQAIIASVIFGLSLITLYSASTLYHASKDPVKRQKLRIFDHSAIFILIAGTYTPFAMIPLQGWIGNALLLTIWSIAASGVLLKIFFTGRFKRLSTAIYIGMGWIAVVAIKPLSESLLADGLWWILAGGVSYTIGAILYSIKTIPYNHAIFHVFVLVGSFCHFYCIYRFVI